MIKFEAGEAQEAEDRQGYFEGDGMTSAMAWSGMLEQKS